MTNVYPDRTRNPHCHCQGSPVAAFFCSVGHMLECHYPYDCVTAGCSHLARYDFTPDDVKRLEAAAREKIRTGELYPYYLDENGTIAVHVSPDPDDPAMLLPQNKMEDEE